MGVRLSGGIGPLRASLPLGPIGTALIVWPLAMFWWMFVYAMYWPMRLMFFDLPRAIIRSRRAPQLPPARRR